MKETLAALCPHIGESTDMCLAVIFVGGIAVPSQIAKLKRLKRFDVAKQLLVWNFRFCFAVFNADVRFFKGVPVMAIVCQPSGTVTLNSPTSYISFTTQTSGATLLPQPLIIPKQSISDAVSAKSFFIFKIHSD